MKISNVSVSMAAVALLAGGVALWPANAQPTDKPAGGGQPTGDQPPARPNGPRRDRPNRPTSEWREKYRDELREHPRLANALVSAYEAKDYLSKVQGDLGGHKAASIKACDDLIKELTEAIKSDEKAPDRRADRPGRDAKPGDKPAGDKPSGDKPAPKP